MTHYQRRRRDGSLPRKVYTHEAPVVVDSKPAVVDSKPAAVVDSKPAAVEDSKPAAAVVDTLLTPQQRMAPTGASIADDRREFASVVRRLKNGVPVPANVTLEPEEMSHWDQIIAARAVSSWYEAELVRAAQLARLRRRIEEFMCDMTTDIDELRRLTQMMRLEVVLAREIHVNTTAHRGRKDSGELLKREQKMHAAVDDDDGLDAQPVRDRDD